MFQVIDEKELNIVIDAMEIMEAPFEAKVIVEGDRGDALYIVESGRLDCKKVIKGTNTYLKTYKSGESFGELSLLYNVPRAASITAVEDCVLYKLDRDTFNNIVKDAAMRRREMYEEFLKKVPLLKDLDNYDRTQISDAFKQRKFKQDELIIKEGEEGNEFYFVVEGTCSAMKVIEGVPTHVKPYASGDYFGELALIGDGLRKASIIVTSPEITVVSLDKATFNRCLGKLETILKRNSEGYKNGPGQSN